MSSPDQVSTLIALNATDAPLLKGAAPATVNDFLI
jgi:hypothetical protein